jgi:hypothetical protein
MREMVADLKPAIPRFNQYKLRREVMSKPLLGMILGAVLGFLDGLSAFFYPGVASMMMGIIIGSTLKGLLTGLVTGFVARKLHSLPLGILTGLSVGLVLSYWAAATSPDPQGRYYYLEIMLPGSVLGAVVGFATQKFGKPSKQPAQSLG